MFDSKSRVLRGKKKDSHKDSKAQRITNSEYKSFLCLSHFKAFAAVYTALTNHQRTNEK
jgi:hypothetical protein